MRLVRRICTIGFLLASLAAPSSAAAATRIKLATLAPDGSPWHLLLQEMGDRWQRDSGGDVQLVIYPGGVAGDDRDVLRKIRIGQLQAGTLTITGLTDLDPAFQVFNIPLFFDSFEEFASVLERLTPELDAALVAKGFVRLHWAYGGWVHIFTTRETSRVGDLRKLKIFADAGDAAWVGVWKASGFNPVPLSATDVLMGLQSGMIEGLPVPPLGALALQWYKQTPYMIETGVSPLLGATIVRRSVWDKLSDSRQRRMLEVAQQTGSSLFDEIREKDRTAIEAMTKRGLRVTRVSSAEEPAWREAATRFADAMRERLVPERIYGLASGHRDAFRRRGETGETP